MSIPATRFRTVHDSPRSGARLGKALVPALLGLSLPLLAARPAQACSCLPPTVESSYNNSSDVIEARVLLSLPVGAERWMLAHVRAAYKGCLEPGELVLLTTPLSSASCGITLQSGQVYLINGTDDGSALGLERLSIGLCDYNLPVADLTEHDEAFLDGREVCCGDECSCANGELPVQCFAQPCSVAPACDVEGAVCVDNYCGGCNAEFYDPFGNAVCQAPVAECTSDADCSRTGCSGQICSSETVITTCEFREEYACYADPAITTCGCHDGQCAFDPTDELAQCLADGGP